MGFGNHGAGRCGRTYSGFIAHADIPWPIPMPALTFDLDPQRQTRTRNYRAGRWVVWGFYCFLAAFLLYEVWFGFSVGLGTFTLSLLGIGGSLTIAFLILFRLRGRPNWVRVSPEGLELHFTQGTPLPITWANGGFTLRFLPNVAGMGGQKFSANPWWMALGWRGAAVSTEVKDAILDSAMAHSRVTVLTGYGRPGEEASRNWLVRPKRVGDEKLAMQSPT